ncbi:uncharacterized protein G2W53_035983 [Senna tora]|uniref:Transmembrane protein n=1 Tax=Senna tora TaxID=362788 RepID=A0A834W4D6_9FABA|nr:uncharacterized protein G2W53_035983 [Senna tora]
MEEDGKSRRRREEPLNAGVLRLHSNDEGGGGVNCGDGFVPNYKLFTLHLLLRFTCFSFLIGCNMLAIEMILEGINEEECVCE